MAFNYFFTCYACKYKYTHLVSRKYCGGRHEICQFCNLVYVKSFLSKYLYKWCKICITLHYMILRISFYNYKNKKSKRLYVYMNMKPYRNVKFYL